MGIGFIADTAIMFGTQVSVDKQEGSIVAAWAID